MTAHLTDEQLAQWVIGDRDLDTADHLDHCSVCRESIEDVDSYIGNYRDAVLSSRGHDPSFWANQTRAIHARSHESAQIPVLRWAYMVTMLLVFCAAFLVTRMPHPQHRVVASESADDVLLQEIESDVDREYPIALAPAALIAAERDQVLSASGENSFNHALHKEQER